jgi:hypothetical protein
MYALTMAEGALLALALLGVTGALTFGVLAGFPRALTTVSGVVTCPMVRRRVAAELVRDDWTRRCVDVRRCGVLGGRVDLCNKGCR